MRAYCQRLVVSKNKITTATRKPRTAHAFPRWFADDRNQAIAEWLAHNYFIDMLVGREPSPDITPYSDYERSVVEQFLARLREAAATNSLVSSIRVTG